MDNLVEAARNRQLDDETKIQVLLAAAAVLRDHVDEALAMGWDCRVNGLRRCVSRLHNVAEHLELERVKAEARRARG